MTPWTMALLALLPVLAIPAIFACQGGTADRLAAVQLTTSITTLMLVLMTYAFDQSSFIDLALTVVLLAPPGTLIITLFLERWL